MQSDSKFSCDSCGRSYAWKPQLAGKRVKCKCGQAVTVPDADPAVDAGFGDLAALADDHSAASADGPTCPECGAGLDEGAVLCVNCGFNLKTGKRLGTAKLATKEFDTAATGAAGYISRGPKKTADDEEVPPEKKRVQQLLLLCGLAVIVAGLVVAGVMMNNSRKKRNAELAAQGPGRLERLIKATENQEEGLVGAMKDGSIMGAVDPRRNRNATGGNTAAANSATAKLQQAERAEKVEAQLEKLLNTQSPVEAAAFFQKGPTATMVGYDQAKSKAMLEEIMAAGAQKVMVLQNNKQEGTHFFVYLPWDEAKRAKLFALQERMRKANNQAEPNPPDDGQKYLAIAFSPAAG
jgi:hypothetical protein